MTDAAEWNDEARENLRNVIRADILGELRLAKRDHDDILDGCQEVHVQDECPESEWEMFEQFAIDELEQTSARLDAEQEAWPERTDSDRLDEVEVALRDRGIVFWQASPCCDTCTMSELGGRVDELEEQHPGFFDRLRGYAFYIDQNLPEMLADDTKVTVFLAYGWQSAEKKPVKPSIYEQNALGIAREVYDCLRAAGFEPAWDWTLASKIGVSINWQRRTMLE